MSLQSERMREAIEVRPDQRPKIRVENVSKRFLRTKSRLFTKEWSPGVEALHDVSVDFPEFSFVAVLGPSGCGKTTLLHIIAGLIPASSGTILIDDKAVVGPRRGSGMGIASATNDSAPASVLITISGRRPTRITSGG